MSEDPDTFHAPSARCSSEQLAGQIAALDRDRAFSELLHCVPDGVLILNDTRQIIYANRAALALGGVPHERVIGLRPGEFLGCSHSGDCEGGCGTTRFCRYCGGVNAILQARQGRATVEECHILVARPRGEEALDLRVWATPMAFGPHAFIFYAFLDIGDEKRRFILERIFLHDIGNTTTAMKGFLALLAATAEQPAQRDLYLHRVDFLSDQILEEIHAHRMLMAAEAGDLVLDPKPLTTLGVLRDVMDAYDRPAMLNGRKLAMAPASGDGAFASDPALLGRVLGNMVKNAIEASAPGESVTLSCAREGGGVSFAVANPTYMPENIRLQVFNRSFSTKGAGRGLGTYSMKFLSERYLGGRVGFTTSETEGTVFTARYPLHL